jgi:hypothetical protein
MAEMSLAEARARRSKAMLFESIDEALPTLFRDVQVEEAKLQQLREVIWHYDSKPDPFAACVRDFMEEFGPGKTERICGTLADLIRAYGRGEPITMSDDQSLPELTPDFAEFLLSIDRESIDRFQREVLDR